MNEPILTLRHMDDIVYIILNMDHIGIYFWPCSLEHTVWNILASILYKVCYIYYINSYSRGQGYICRIYGYIWVKCLSIFHRLWKQSIYKSLKDSGSARLFSQQWLGIFKGLVGPKNLRIPPRIGNMARLEENISGQDHGQYIPCVLRRCLVRSI